MQPYWLIITEIEYQAQRRIIYSQIPPEVDSFKFTVIDSPCMWSISYNCEYI